MLEKIDFIGQYRVFDEVKREFQNKAQCFFLKRKKRIGRQSFMQVH